MVFGMRITLVDGSSEQVMLDHGKGRRFREIFKASAAVTITIVMEIKLIKKF
jgi:hypothetical protein